MVMVGRRGKWDRWREVRGGGRMVEGDGEGGRGHGGRIERVGV